MQALESKGRFAIWKRTSSPTSAQTIRKDITRYLSEHTKKGVDDIASVGQNHPNWLKQGVDYLTKEEQGKLKVYGFLRDDVIKRTGSFPHRMKNDDLVDACLQAWKARLKKKKIKRVAHKYVLSLNPEMCRVMAETGHSADELLTASVRKTVRKYQEKYYPKEKLGYLVGIHHDKAHLHAHVMLFPTTESGKLIRVTDESAKRGGRKPFQEMRKFAEREVANFYRREIKNPFKASVHNPARYMQPKILAWVISTRGKKIAEEKGLTPDERSAWQYQERENLLKGDPRDLRKALREGYEAVDDIFKSAMQARKFRPEMLDNLLKANKDDRSIRARMLHGLHAEQKELKAEVQDVKRTKREIYQDMTNWTHYRFNFSSVTDGGNNMRDHEVADWVAKKLAKSDPLGSLIRDWVDEKRSRNEQVNLPKEMLQIMASASNPVAAQKFTEKDKFARKCIKYGAGKIRDPALTMLEHYYRQNAFISNHSQKDFVREFLRSSLRVQQNEMKAIKERREEIQQKIKQIKLQQEALKLQGDTLEFVKAAKRPSFLEEFKFWQDSGTEISMEALDAIKRGQKSVGDTDSRVDASDFNASVQRRLAEIRKNRMGLELNILGRVGQAKQAVAEPGKTVRGLRSEVADETLRQPNATKFLSPRRDTQQRGEQPNEKSAEERRKEVRATHMTLEDVSVLDR